MFLAKSKSTFCNANGKISYFNSNLKKHIIFYLFFIYNDMSIEFKFKISIIVNHTTHTVPFLIFFT